LKSQECQGEKGAGFFACVNINHEDESNATQKENHG
jgi:hypothetical protein